MKIFHLFISCCATILPFASPIEAGILQSIKEVIWGREAPPPTIKVLLCYNQTTVGVEIQGQYELYDPHKKELISSRLFGKGQYFRAISGGLKWGEEFPGVYQLKIVPDEDAVLLVDKKPYKGALYVYNVEGAISVVNEVSIEDYLSATLTGSFGGTLPQEALAAVAIAARTWAYYSATHPKTRFWAVDATKVGYEGSGSVQIGSSMERAIVSTRHMVMSRTAAYEKVITPFLAEWNAISASSKAEGEEASRLTLQEVEGLAKKGNNAAQILSKAFPGAAIVLSYP